jgi:cytidylate kinase
MKIIGISGPNGSGKDLLGELLAKRHNYMFVSVTNALREECDKRRIPQSRQNTSMISAEWRREHGLAVLVDKAIEKYEAASKTHQYDGLVMASLRNPGEADKIHELGGQMVWVDADPKVRYERAITRGKNEADQKSFEVFMAEEQDEMAQGGDAATLNMAAVKEKCEITVFNNSNDIDEFDAEIVAKLGIS